MPRKKTQKITVFVEENRSEEVRLSSRRQFAITVSVDDSLLNVPDRMAELGAVEALVDLLREGVIDIVEAYVQSAEDLVRQAARLRTEGVSEHRFDEYDGSAERGHEEEEGVLDDHYQPEQQQPQQKDLFY
ncbi:MULTISPECIES: hypothetical protein [Cyanophyceae]|uniref:hypothetical protein n=1 Tax=Cyanophyceae TaxID=3028117 RepID=UPI001688B35A|nr:MULTISPECIES: hypothetical protein [Cyanophyceae]MBD1919448.1 hypothetical protein [Phormidium sp. FACHB-77]MBD2054300.1 hypothetical protein [Leptolyngbya sp. FACHB-60]